MNDNSFFEATLANWNFHFFLWGLVFALLLLLIYLTNKKKYSPYPLAKLNVRFGPLLIVIIFMHRVLFDLPHNLGAIYDENYFTFWFTPFRLSDFPGHWQLYLAFLIAGLLFYYYAYRINKKYFLAARGMWLPAAAIVIWYIAGVGFAHVPDYVLWLKDESQYEVSDLFLNLEVVNSIVAGLLLASLASYLTKVSARSKEAKESSFFYQKEPITADTQLPPAFWLKEMKSVPVVSDLPVLGDIVESIQVYYINTYNMIISRASFLSQVILAPHNNSFKKSMNYFSTGLGVGFLILTPFFLSHHQSASKSIFVLREVCGIVMYSYFLHLALVILGVNKSGFKPVAIMLGYVWGLTFPLWYLLCIPLLAELGPEFMFSGSGESIYGVSQHTLQVFEFIGFFGGFIVFVIWLRYVFPWFSKVFKVTYGKLLLAFLLGGFPAGLIIGFFFGPLFNWLEKIIGAWL
jgi:hypothetical protein